MSDAYQHGIDFNVSCHKSVYGMGKRNDKEMDQLE